LMAWPMDDDQDAAIRHDFPEFRLIASAGWIGIWEEPVLAEDRRGPLYAKPRSASSRRHLANTVTDVGAAWWLDPDAVFDSADLLDQRALPRL
jgi:hypothetical protein